MFHLAFFRVCRTSMQVVTRSITSVSILVLSFTSCVGPCRCFFTNLINGLVLYLLFLWLLDNWRMEKRLNGVFLVFHFSFRVDTFLLLLPIPFLFRKLQPFFFFFFCYWTFDSSCFFLLLLVYLSILIVIFKPFGSRKVWLNLSLAYLLRSVFLLLFLYIVSPGIY